MEDLNGGHTKKCIWFHGDMANITCQIIHYKPYIFLSKATWEYQLGRDPFIYVERQLTPKNTTFIICSIP